MLLIFVLICFSYLSFYVITKIINFFDGTIKDLSFNSEDIIVAGLSYLSLILIFLKILDIVPVIDLIFKIILGLTIITVILLLIESKINYKNIFIHFHKPKLQYVLWFIVILAFYIFRALFKAKNFNEVSYIPVRYNNDIFLYLRRGTVFLSDRAALNHQYDGISAIDILYNSPKLLSSLVYAIFIDIFQYPGIAATVLTSIILTAIVFKYILLIQKDLLQAKFIGLLLVGLIIFEPNFSWLQDQFYLSNLLYIYLLIYAVQDFFGDKKANNKNLLKFTFAAITTAGFYPSQLPFLTVGYGILVLLSDRAFSVKKVNIIKLTIITITVFIIFISQYLETSEVIHHFNLTDSIHGINFRYIPFWSIFSITPKAGGFKVSIGSVILIVVSIMMMVLTTKYLSKKNPSIAKFLFITSFLYTIYSLSFVIIPGSYRQGKFFITYIIPIALYCFLKILVEPSNININRNFIVKFLLFFLVIYITHKSFILQYKTHIKPDIVEAISYIKAENKSVVIYQKHHNNRYYYFSERLRNLNLSIITKCPEPRALKDLESIIVIDSSCNPINLKANQSNLIKIEF